jgi:hypothetical protein
VAEGGRAVPADAFRGTARVSWMVTFATAFYNLVRMRRLVAA